MKKFIAILFVMMSFHANASIDPCVNGKVLYSGTLSNDAGSERLCYLPITGTYYFGTKDNDERYYTYVIPNKVEPFLAKEKNETLKGYKVSIDSNLLTLTAHYINDEIVNGFITVNKDVFMDFTKESVIYSMID